MTDEQARQAAAEQRARGLLQRPVLEKARRQCGFLWQMAYGVDTPDDAAPEFDDAMDEYLANYVLKAVASDGNYPAFVQDFMTPWGERLGARMGGDNPDNGYRLCGITHGASYRVRGRPRGKSKPPSNVSFTLTANYGTSVTVDLIEDFQLVRAADGSFEITIDDQPANGRNNHLTTAPQAKFLYVRDSIGDWRTERPFLLEVERLEPPSAPPLSDQEMAERAAFRAVEDVPLYYWFQRLTASGEVNALRGPVESNSFGGLVTQASALGRIRLGEDDIGILTYDPADAAYVALSAYDWWFRSIDTAVHQSSLTQANAQRNADGTITCVIAREDPGVANWIDVGAYRTVLLLIRWQGLPLQRARQPVQTLKLVKRGTLSENLPAGMAMISPAERAAQYRDRKFDALHRWDMI